MRKLVFAALVLVGLYAAASTGFARELGRTDPASAGYFRPPLFNFSDEYRTGAALGFRIGSTRAQAFRDIATSGLEIYPACWGDIRAGGASLYSPKALAEKARVQPYICLGRPRTSVILHFERDRLGSVEVTYVRTDIIM